ncbi:DeoR/GlpR family DNA-binding transcription regulator [Microbacterium sp. NPDC076911]|uniref:DeoR/GlpR family DNA-binding transcription regulator n=1 Tax=Microbacterium sp. NPDC076911 TaxID=3154958 RepID=UPI00341C53AA
MSQRYDFVREEGILQDLNAHGRVVVNDLAERLGVSAVTIRKDLATLEERSLLRRVRGGAVASSTGEEGAFAERLRKDANTKREIAREAAQLVPDGSVIAMDSSTTTYYMALELLDRRDLIVITYGMRVATLFMDHSRATVIMPGGVLRRASASMVGAISNVMEGRGRIDMGFFGVASLSLELGLLELSNEEAFTKQGLVAATDAVYGLFTSSKINSFGLHTFADVDTLAGLYTDEHADDSFVSKWEARGVPVHRVAGTGAILDDSIRAQQAVNGRSRDESGDE